MNAILRRGLYYLHSAAKAQCTQKWGNARFHLDFGPKSKPLCKHWASAAKVIKFYSWNGTRTTICHLAARFALLVSGPTRRIRSICICICIFNSIPICLLHWQVNINDYLLHSNWFAMWPSSFNLCVSLTFYPWATPFGCLLIKANCSLERSLN